ncbi:hypothetical protein LR48_Vigan02g134300 [Vigna angularis]|uniref:Uncharacterized protein n=1 Tax=Phaseolus angularis TaxID=3914 RepID=A0A0L9TX78_PHAAN|nr:hypothetical protein LR48_Vigan02g134300 [Vigna angularis]
MSNTLKNSFLSNNFLNPDLLPQFSGDPRHMHNITSVNERRRQAAFVVARSGAGDGSWRREDHEAMVRRGHDDYARGPDSWRKGEAPFLFSFADSLHGERRRQTTFMVARSGAGGGSWGREDHNAMVRRGRGDCARTLVVLIRGAKGRLSFSFPLLLLCTMILRFWWC